jgi:GTP cyclohydrolase-4
VLTLGYGAVPAEVMEDPREFLNMVTDVPSSMPALQIPVAEAGVADHPVFFEVRSFADRAETLPVHGTVSATATLTGEQRGVHMSRIVESLQHVSSQVWDSVDDFIRALSEDVAKRQGLDRSRARFDGTTLINGTAPMTGRLSRDSWGVHAEATCTDGHTDSEVGVTATIMTACPCTRAHSWYSAVIDLADIVDLEMAHRLGERLVTFTHSQRATVTATVTGGPGGLALEDCYAAICESTHVVHELLKRPDEHALVRRAHEHPQFTEDVVREVAGALATRAHGRASGDAQLHVASAALESIHAHAVQSRVEGSVAELAALAAASTAVRAGISLWPWP